MKPKDVTVQALREGWTRTPERGPSSRARLAPLEKILPLEWCGGFTFMGYSGDIRLYKHGFTRNYLNLDPKGKSFRYTARGYVPTSFEVATEHVFDGLEELGETRSSVYAAIRSKHKGLKKAGSR